MKRAEAPIRTRSEKRPLGLWDFNRWAALLTLWVTALVVVIAAFKADPNIWLAIAGVWFLVVCAVWLVMFAVDCLAMIFVAIWRLSKRVTPIARVETERTLPHGGLWDTWMDGPEPR
ncbi:MAG: hypothetical protein ACLQIB_18400 [Isosphaeraceae bacterium]